MSAPQSTDSAVQWRVTWERVGRNHSVPPTLITGADDDSISEAIYNVARKYTNSAGIEVFWNTEDGSVLIVAGMRNAGSGRIERVSA